MKIIIIVFFSGWITQKVICNDTLYYAALKNSIELAATGYNLENFRQLANCSERITLIYKDDWLPYYYAAYAYTNMSFIEKNEANQEVFCDKAQQFLDDAFKIKPDASELYVLQSLLYFARMSSSPMLKGPIYIAKATSALNDAEKLDPSNPRIYYLRGKSTMYTPKFFGGGKEAAIPIFEKAISRYESFIPQSKVHPDWGKEDAEKLYKVCKANVN